MRQSFGMAPLLSSRGQIPSRQNAAGADGEGNLHPKARSIAMTCCWEGFLFKIDIAASCYDAAGRNKCLGNIEILFQTVSGVQWVGLRQNCTRKEPQLKTSLGKAVRKKLCKEPFIKHQHQPPTPNPQLLPNPIASTLPSQSAPAQLCNRFGCTSSRLSLPTGAASSGESKWITAPAAGGKGFGWFRTGHNKPMNTGWPCPPFSRGGFRRKYDLLVMPQISFENRQKATGKNWKPMEILELLEILRYTASTFGILKYTK